jgi:hypothetical protein
MTKYDKYLSKKLFIMFLRNNMTILTGNNSIEIEKIAEKAYDDAIKFQKPSHIEYLRGLKNEA